jgi:hypothetical protein
MASQALRTVPSVRTALVNRRALFTGEEARSQPIPLLLLLVLCGRLGDRLKTLAAATFRKR